VYLFLQSSNLYSCDHELDISLCFITSILHLQVNFVSSVKTKLTESRRDVAVLRLIIRIARGILEIVAFELNPQPPSIVSNKPQVAPEERRAELLPMEDLSIIFQAIRLDQHGNAELTRKEVDFLKSMADHGAVKPNSPPFPLFMYCEDNVFIPVAWLNTILMNASDHEDEGRRAVANRALNQLGQVKNPKGKVTAGMHYNLLILQLLGKAVVMRKNGGSSSTTFEGVLEGICYSTWLSDGETEYIVNLSGNRPWSIPFTFRGLGDGSIEIEEVTNSAGDESQGTDSAKLEGN
jgi:hypothetical protein